MLAAVLLTTVLAVAFATLVAAVPAVGAPDHQAPSRLHAALTRADSILEAAVERERIAGAVLLVAWDGRLLRERAYGYARLYDYGDPARPYHDHDRLARLSDPEPMTSAHLFDLASLTKVFATTFAVMLLVDRGELALDSPVHEYLPGFRGPRKDSMTVRHLLTHTAGLEQWKPIYYHARTAEEAFEHIRDLPLRWGVGEDRHYSDLGFMLLGYIVQRVSGRTLDVFLEQELYGPVGLEATAFDPRDRGLGPFAATSHGNPFERRMVADDGFGYRIEDVDPGAFTDWRRYTLAGEVNDGNAYHAHGGVAGHAGLFSTAAELRVLLDLLLAGGVHEGRRLLDAATVDRFLTPDAHGNGLGWAMEPAVIAVDDPPAGTFAHGGFTGTFALGAPAHDLAIVLLANRQNVGVDDDGGYTDMGALRRPIVEGILRAAADDTSAR